MLVIDGYQLGEQIYESPKSIIFRGRHSEDEQSYILKILKEDFAESNEVLRYRQEYEMISMLSSKYIIRAYDLLRFRKTYVIALEDLGAKSLAMLMKTPVLGIVDMLKTAIQVVKGLRVIHGQRMIHKDICPSNIVMNPGTGETKIIDFGISTLLPRQKLTAQNARHLEGTLLYISPEQSGRMNRYLDYRSDYYSFGATLYHLLCGKPPFEANDNLELVHGHLARVPVEPHEVVREVPIALSKIVMKLLAKLPEDRYQSAGGIEADLSRCLNEITAGRKHFTFEVASQDVWESFQIPQKLYGREHERQELLSIFDHIFEGGMHALTLVSGYSGIGKTSLVQELHKSVTEQRGYYVTGKYDQLNVIPYSAIAAAFRSLLQQFLSETEDHLAVRKKIWLEVLDGNGRILCDLIPEIELVIGPQPRVPELGPVERENRFQNVFVAFLKTICLPESPLVIFLDDLQWADDLSLKLIQLMLTESTLGSFMLIGAYRDNEVGSGHPLSLMKQTLEEAEVSIHYLKLTNLKQEHMRQLLVDTLHRDDFAVTELSELLMRKTDGNPFFATQLLQDLQTRELIWFSINEADQAQWHWDSKQIERVGVTRNVVELMIQKINLLPEPAREVLKLAACIGNRFSLSLLHMIQESSEIGTYRNLIPSLKQGFILAESELLPLEDEAGDPTPAYVAYRFHHDRIQQAAYALIADDQKAQFHLQIAQKWYQHMSESERNQHVFELADHFGKGALLVQSGPWRLTAIQLNLDAAVKAREATAYASELQYLQTAMALISEDDARDHYATVFKLLQLRSEAEYFNGNLQAMEQYANQAIDFAKTELEKAEIYKLLIIQYTVLSRCEDALIVGRIALEKLGVKLPESDFDVAFAAEREQLYRRLGDRSVSSLIDLAQAESLDHRMVLDLLANLIPAAYLVAPELMVVIAIKSVNLSLQRGDDAASVLGYALYGLILGTHFEDLQQGYEWSMLGLKVSHKYEDKNQLCQAIEVLVAHVAHWVKPFDEVQTLEKEGVMAGLAAGNLQWAGYILNYSASNAFVRGQRLQPYRNMIHEYLDYLEKKQIQTSYHIVLGYCLITQSLTVGDQETPTFTFEGHTEASFLDSSKASNLSMPPAIYMIHKAQVLYLFEHYQQAYDILRDFEPQLAWLPGTSPVADFYFYHALTLAALIPDTSAEAVPEMQAEFKRFCQRLAFFSQNCAANFEHKSLLLKAEAARLEDDFETAIGYYDQAISRAAEQEFLQVEALANELCGRYLLQHGWQKMANFYLQEALRGYALWGAVRKEKGLRKRYTFLTMATQGRGPNTGTFGTTTGDHPDLDMTSAIKASRAISGEILLPDLLKKMMEILIENANAQRGLLLRPHVGKWVVEAEGQVGDKEIELPQKPVETYTLALSVLNYVYKTKRHVALADANNDRAYAQDPYLQRHDVKSLLCYPVLHQGKVQSVIYLENNLITGAFTQDRLDFLGLLAAQVAVSFENARLYNNLELLVEDRTSQLQKTLGELGDKHKQLQHTQEQLVQSAKMASLGTLSSGIAHEINNPNNFIKQGSANALHYLDDFRHFLFELLEQDDDELKKEFDQKLKVVQDQHQLVSEGAERIRRIVESLLVFSRADESELKNANIAATLKSTLLFVRHRFEESVQFDTDFQDEPRIWCRASELNQAFLNIIVNACQAIQAQREQAGQKEKGQLQITGFLTGDIFVIRFRDTGCGIPETVRERIFEPFFTTKNIGEGAGLGLSIAFGIINRHRGGISVESQSGKGTVITVTLPVNQQF